MRLRVVIFIFGWTIPLTVLCIFYQNYAIYRTAQSQCFTRALTAQMDNLPVKTSYPSSCECSHTDVMQLHNASEDPAE